MSAPISDLWYFFLYAFLGWCVEVIYAAVSHGVFVNRGFLNGPVCPIYGFGVVTVLIALTPLKENLGLLFLGSVVLTSLLELLTGFCLDKLFHHKWWDYSKTPFNIGGYVCLKFSLAWGLACVMVVDVIHPALASLVALIPPTLSTVLLILFSAAFIVDCAVTVAGVRKLNRHLAQLEEIGRALHKVSDAIGEPMADRAIAADAAAERLRAESLEKREELAAKREALIERIAREQKRILNAFPDLESRRHPDLLQRIKDRLRR